MYLAAQESANYSARQSARTGITPGYRRACHHAKIQTGLSRSSSCWIRGLGVKISTADHVGAKRVPKPGESKPSVLEYALPEVGRRRARHAQPALHIRHDHGGAEGARVVRRIACCCHVSFVQDHQGDVEVQRAEHALQPLPRDRLVRAEEHDVLPFLSPQTVKPLLDCLLVRGDVALFCARSKLVAELSVRAQGVPQPRPFVRIPPPGQASWHAQVAALSTVLDFRA